ncbi:MAG: hypothetical protein K2Y40_24050 [Reyranella sp.]|nr:hypothetical protein [Reyranella sp.]
MANDQRCLEIAATYLRDALGLNEAEYRLGLRGVDRDTGLTVVFALHRDDLAPRTDVLLGGGDGKSRVLLVDRTLERVDSVLRGQ